MSKARRTLKERVKRSDMLLEVLDARLPEASQNPMLAQLRGNLPCLRILTKPDLADPQQTERWVKAFKAEGVSAMPLLATAPKSAKRLIAECRRLVPNRGQPAFPVRVMIAGIPNVGKSTIFNLLLGRRMATVRDQPAVTRMEQRVEVPGGLALVDTPGVLWPKFDDQEAAYRLAASGAIRDAVVDPIEVARFVVRWLAQDYPNALQERYGVETNADDPDSTLAAIASRRGCITRGVGPDLVKASELMLNELRAGRLGRISFEKPANGPGAESVDSDAEE